MITSECNLVFPNFSLQYFPLESKSDCFLFAQISLLLLLQHLKDIKLPSVSAVVVTKLPWILLRVRSTIALPTSPAIFSHNNSHHRCKQVLGLHFHRQKNQWCEKWQGLQGSHWELPLPQQHQGDSLSLPGLYHRAWTSHPASFLFHKVKSFQASASPLEAVKTGSSFEGH